MFYSMLSIFLRLVKKYFTQENFDHKIENFRILEYRYICK